MKEVRYHVGIHDAHAHLYSVRSSFEGPFDGGVLELSLPIWTPGSYLTREFARNVIEAWAEDAEGKRIPCKKSDKATWRIEAGGASRVTFATRVYANDLTVRTSHLDGTHAYFNGANILPFRKSELDAKCRLTLDPPAGWKVATTLPKQDDGSWLADDYDHLIDCPVEMGTHESFSFDVDGVPHDVAIWGGAGTGTRPVGNYDREALGRDLEKIVRSQSKLMGGLPMKRYLFLIHLTDRGRGGLEHRDSTTLLYPRFGFRPKKEYEEFLRLASHEYFHLWNVKRLKPKAFDPFDLTKEAYTRLLWAMEGVTEYYEVMSMARAGLLSIERLLAIWGEEITGMLRTPGRKVQSVGDSSFDTWIKYYRPDENSVNSGISYYRKGALVALCLDMEIRRRTKNEKSFDDVMRLLFERHGAKGKGAPEDAYAKALAEVSGASMDELLARYVDGTDELEFAKHVDVAGLSFKTRTAENGDDKGGKAPPKKKASEDEDPAPPVWLGFDTRGERGRAVVTNVLAGSPAQAGGLYASDEIVAIDGWRADEKGCRNRCAEHVPGDRIAFHVLRRDRLVELAIVAAEPPKDTAWLEVDAAAPADAKKVLDSWSGGGAS